LISRSRATSQAADTAVTAKPILLTASAILSTTPRVTKATGADFAVDSVFRKTQRGYEEIAQET